LLCLCAGCEEKLPTYAPPVNIAEGILGRNKEIDAGLDTTGTILIRHHCANYAATRLLVALKNTYEETLEGTRFVRVIVEIEGLDPLVPFYRRLYKELIGPVQTRIRLNPGEQYEVILPWDRRDQSGHLIDTGLDTTYFAVPDTTINMSPPILFRLRASIQVWEEVPAQTTNEFIIRMIFIKNQPCSEGFVR
jgi:hypothetical protein